MHQKCQKYFFYLIEDDDQEEDIERGTRQADVGEVVEKFKHFDHVLFQVRIHLKNKKKIQNLDLSSSWRNLAKPSR